MKIKKASHDQFIQIIDFVLLNSFVLITRGPKSMATINHQQFNLKIQVKLLK
jgi:hypothetical protein